MEMTMHKFYNKKEREILESYKTKLSANYRSLPYDLNKKEDLKEYLDLVLMSYMDYKNYFITANDLVESLDETLERVEPLTWLSLGHESIEGDQKILETINALNFASSHMNEMFMAVENKLRHLMQVILHHDDAVQQYVLGQAYNFDEEKFGDVFEELMDEPESHTLNDAYKLFKNILDDNLMVNDSENQPIVLHLEIMDDLEDEEKKTMIKRGKTLTNGCISRDIVVPPHMTLHQLHYTIQRLFGWQNSHLRSFELNEEDLIGLTGGMFKKWSDLSGLIFTDIEDNYSFYDNDYTGGNFKSYLKGKYSGTDDDYDFESIHSNAQDHLREFKSRFPMIDIKESFKDFYERTKNLDRDVKHQMKILRTSKIDDVTLDELRNQISFDTQLTTLLECLKIKDILGSTNQKFTNPLSGKETIAHELNYNYDFGDDWKVKITRCQPKDYEDQETLVRVSELVLTTNQPQCIQAVGLNVLDDVGGMSGFVRMLDAIYNLDDPEEKESMKTWAKSMGWSARKTAVDKML